MRLLAPLLILATIVLFGSGMAMGLLHGHALVVARRLHGPASAIWLLLVGVHVLVHLRRAIVSGTEELRPASRASVSGARARTHIVVASIVAGVVVGAATLPVQHHWLHLPRRHDRGDDRALNSHLNQRAG